jgi:hypothetical protein
VVACIDVLATHKDVYEHIRSIPPTLPPPWSAWRDPTNVGSTPIRSTMLW